LTLLVQLEQAKLGCKYSNTYTSYHPYHRVWLWGELLNPPKNMTTVLFLTVTPSGFSQILFSGRSHRPLFKSCFCFVSYFWNAFGYCFWISLTRVHLQQRSRLLLLLRPHWADAWSGGCGILGVGVAALIRS